MQFIQHEFAAEIPLKLVLGGLAPTLDSRVMDEETKQTIREHWQHVRELSGQSFDFSFFDRQEFTYCTEPACRAVVAARHLKPDSALPFLEHLQRSFYTQNLDITQTYGRGLMSRPRLLSLHNNAAVSDRRPERSVAVPGRVAYS